jgi:hypothetical protein
MCYHSLLTRPLLKGEDEEGNEESDSITLGKDLLPGSALGGSLLLGNGSDNLGKLGPGLVVIFIGLSDPSEVLHGEVVSVLGGEPSWRFLEQREKSKHDADGDQLEADGDSPLDVALDRESATLQTAKMF